MSSSENNATVTNDVMQDSDTDSLPDLGDEEACSDCGHVHGGELNELLLSEFLSRGNTFQVPEERKQSRPQNDQAWETIGKGPSKDNYPDLDVKDGDIDDIATAYSQEWYAAVQAVTNMIAILGKVVDKYDVKEDERNHDFPQGIKQIFSTGSMAVKVEKLLTGEKNVFFTLEKIRKDWGSISAYATAPEEERKEWFDANGSNAMMMMMMAMMMGGGGSDLMSMLGNI